MKSLARVKTARYVLYKQTGTVTGTNRKVGKKKNLNHIMSDLQHTQRVYEPFAKPSLSFRSTAKALVGQRCRVWLGRICLCEWFPSWKMILDGTEFLQMGCRRVYGVEVRKTETRVSNLHHPSVWQFTYLSAQHPPHPQECRTLGKSGLNRGRACWVVILSLPSSRLSTREIGVWGWG